jgi:hypothetical protein
MVSGWYEVDVDSREGGWREGIPCRLLLSTALKSPAFLLAKDEDGDKGDEDKEREGEPSSDEDVEDGDEDGAWIGMELWLLVVLLLFVDEEGQEGAGDKSSCR